MNNVTIFQAIQIALSHHQAGRLGEAEGIYRQILQVDPQNPDASHLLGLIALQVGRPDAARDLIARAVSVNPSNPDYHVNLGAAHQALGDFDSAATSYSSAIRLAPNNAGAEFNLGTVLHNQGKHQQAAIHYRKTLALKPDHPEAHCNLGKVLNEIGKTSEAIECLRRAVALKPGYADAHNNLGAALEGAGKRDEAISCYRDAIANHPNFLEAHYNLGLALNASGDFHDSLESFQRVLALNPGFFMAHYGMGFAFNGLGRQEQSLECFRKTIELAPDFLDAWGCRLLGLNYSEQYRPHEIHVEHQRFAEQFEQPLRMSWIGHDNQRDPGKKLKIGYVSADFRRHSVAYFAEPLLANHDRDRFEIHCYYNHTARDEVTERFIGIADSFVFCRAMNDDELAAKIREDKIDILVDLSGHTAGNRLLVFARKPAPLQLTCFGYPGTTGLSAMDYRLTDRYAEPEGFAEQFHSEKLLRLPGASAAYRPCAADPKKRDNPELRVRPTPALQNGHVTFGSINNIAKLTPKVVETWSAILHRLPGSKLLLESFGLDDARMRADIEGRFAGHGIAPSRLRLIGRRPENQYVLYHEIDIALDPFPCNGGTTSMDSAWMGVPFVTLAGDRFSSRLGLAIASQLGHPEWVAQTEEDYVRRALDLASELDRLNELRLGLRAEAEASPLMDEQGFARNMEHAYREMWRKWCEND